MRFTVKTKLWVRAGRPSMLDIRVGNRAVSAPGGDPTNLVLTS